MYFRPVLILLLFIASAQNGLAQVSRPNGLVVFGDSLSDTGNLASVTVNFPFPFFNNRISNGPVLVDYLASELGVQAQASMHTRTNDGGNNFAIAGGNVLGNDTEDLGSQVSAFLVRENNQASSSNLYYLMMGGNDLRDIRSIVNFSIAEDRIAAVAQKFETELNRLYDAGARVFLISNVPDIGRIPETIERQLIDREISVRSRLYVEIYNRKLDAVLSRFGAQPGVIVSKFDLFSELDRILNRASSFGFTQISVGCFTAARFSFHQDCVFGTRFDRFAFFDNIHPSAKTNRIASVALIASIPSLNSIVQNVNIAPIIQLLLD